MDEWIGLKNLALVKKIPISSKKERSEIQIF